MRPAAVLLLFALLAACPSHAGEIFRDCPACPEMVRIPAGSYLMGSPWHEHGRFDAEGPQHVVSVEAFALARYDVTVADFEAFVTESGYETGACGWPKDSAWNAPGFLPRDPVVCVNIQDAQAYIAWLNRKIGGQGNGPYRLPSEAEWEYAARAGTNGARWWGPEIGHDMADCNGCGSPWDNSELAPVGSFPANPFGLYDMLGNVWQWTADCWHESYVGAPADGRPWPGGDCSRRSVRGGSWSSLPRIVRSAMRSGEPAAARVRDYASFVGFRVAKTVQ